MSRDRLGTNIKEKGRKKEKKEKKEKKKKKQTKGEVFPFAPLSATVPLSTTETESQLGSTCSAFVTRMRVDPAIAPQIHFLNKCFPTCTSTAARTSSRM
jgi:hypothetical protein